MAEACWWGTRLVRATGVRLAGAGARLLREAAVGATGARLARAGVFHRVRIPPGTDGVGAGGTISPGAWGPPVLPDEPGGIGIPCGGWLTFPP